MVKPGYENGVHTHADNYHNLPNGTGRHDRVKPTYALEHLATFKVKNEAEVQNPMEKMRALVDLEKGDGLWQQKMYMTFSGQWLVMLDGDQKEIENFPGTLIKEPTAFISDDPLEIFNNILIFSVPGISLGNTEMHFFQVTDVSAMLLVEDLKDLSNGKIITVDRNPPKKEKPKNISRDQYGLAVAAAEKAAEKNAHDREQTERDVKVLNHCFEDIERFVARLRYAAEAIRELEVGKNEHNVQGEALLKLRSRPPVESEFIDILAKHKLALNYVAKLQNHFNNILDPVHNLFTSLQTIVTACNDIYINVRLPEQVVNPLLRRETVNFLNTTLISVEMEFWQSLGPNWTQPKDQFKDHRGSYHPIFYNDWSPEWSVDEEVPYLPMVKKPQPISSPQPIKDTTWLARLQTRNVKIAEVSCNKTASNDKELSVAKGEYLEIIDDSRNWWKARNSAGRIGYVPHTILTAHNFEQHAMYPGHDTESITSSMIDNEFNFVANPDNNYRHTMTPYVAAVEHGAHPSPQAKRSSSKAGAMPRSYSMPPEVQVPVPPPMPPPTDSQTTTPNNTLPRSAAAGGPLAVMRAQTEYNVNNEALLLQDTVNDELRHTLLQRERRRDLEILKTPQIYISQKSPPREVEQWLAAKGFSEEIILKLRHLNGEELFALKPHVIEGYFGQKESRRLISQIVLQKNCCEFKTVRSSELNAKLAKARQKADQNDTDPNEIF